MTDDRADDEKADDAEEASAAADGLEKSVDEEWKTQARGEKEKLERKVKEQAASSGQQRGPDDRAARRTDRDAPPADFLHFVSGMAAQALMQLGAIENSPEGGRKVDLAAARYSIDCLQMFAEKTKGNLTDEEDRYLRAALHDLRMRFVDAARTAGTQGGPSDAAASPSTGTSPGNGGPAG